MAAIPKVEKHNGVKVILEDLKHHPKCPHGPTLLFSRKVGNTERKFYACSACRDRKLCSFFLWADEKHKLTELKLEHWENERVKLLKGINHRNLFILYNKIKSLPSHKRKFCQQCTLFVLETDSNHIGHSLISNITDYQLEHPSEFLPPLENAKKEAQYLFSKDSIKFIVDAIIDLGFKHIICIGTPRIHEYIQSSAKRLSSILLDIDSRFHSFCGPLEFCWYNSFNNYFFFNEAQEVFEDYLRNTREEDTILVTDPPFGGRIEPLAESFSAISSQYKRLNGDKKDLSIFWIFPYFMEPQIQNSLPDFQMLDYKVQYDNHPIFQNGSKGRKQGSPVRIFTNISLNKIRLPEANYKFCQKCDKWVSKENRHCNLCKGCTSKNGETYVHCELCQRCVKPKWQHCKNCQRCAQVDHTCGFFQYSGVCANCKNPGHKKMECPQVQKCMKRKRKQKHSTKKRRMF